MLSARRRVRAVRVSWSRLAVAIALGIGWGCGGSPAPRQCNVDSDCGATGAVCRAGACQASLALSITNPDDGVATNGTLHVEATVEGGQPASVEIVLTAGTTDSTITTIGPPLYAFDWDTRSTPEGTYALRARVLAGASSYESLPIAVTVDRTAPPAPSIAVDAQTSAQPVPVHGVAEASATVTVREGAKVLAQAAANSTPPYEWRTSIPLSDGPHALSASATDAAGNPSVDASTAEVNCVRTNPTVLYRVPAPAQPAPSNVWSRDPITVTFSRAMNHSAVQNSLRYHVGGQAQGVSFAWAGAQDGSETLTIKPAALPDVTGGPARISIDLSSAMTDPAGNPLAVPGDAWTWTVPEWQDLGALAMRGSGFGVTQVAISAGSPVVAFANGEGAIVSVDVHRWTGTAWEKLPSPGSGDREISLDADEQGRIAVAWSDASGHVHAAIMAPGSSTWSTSGVLNNESMLTQNPSLHLDASGNALVTWLERVGSPGAEISRVFAASWNGATGTPLGTAALNATAATSAAVPVMSLDGAGRPRVTWRQDDRVATQAWSGAAWTGDDFLLPTTPPPAMGPPLCDAAGRRPVFTSTDTAAPGTVKVWEYRCPEGTCAPHWQPYAWKVLEGPLNVSTASPAREPSMALDPQGSPVVTWREGSAIYAKRWDSTASTWRRLGGNIASVSEAYEPVVGVGRTGITAVAFPCYVPIQRLGFYAKRYNYAW